MKMSELETKTNPNPNQEYHYVLLQEVNGKEMEAWYYFIRWEGNEENLNYLNDQLNKIEFYIIDDLSTFDLDLEHLLSEKTAKEMTKVEINSVMFHRKFDGKLEKIDFKFKRHHENEDKIVKVFEKIGLGQIEDYVDGEDIDPEDLVEVNENDETDKESEEESGSEDSESESSSSSSSEEEKRKKKGKSKKEAIEEIKERQRKMKK